MTRSFGDHGMKDFVTANPYVTETRCALACDDFLRAAPVGKNLAFLFCLLFLSFIEQIVRVDSNRLDCFVATFADVAIAVNAPC